MFVIQRVDDGLYVAAYAGHTGSSYTNHLQKAKVYATRDEAERDKCGNETIIPIREAFNN